MRKNVKRVAAAFLAGYPCIERNVWTDGRWFCSYAMKLGERLMDGRVRVIKGRMPSATTSQHLAALVLAVEQHFGQPLADVARCAGWDEDFKPIPLPPAAPDKPKARRGRKPSLKDESMFELEG